MGKKIWVLLFLSLYGLGQSCFAFQIHYCQGRFVRMETAATKKPCCEKKAKLPQDCCSYAFQTLKSDHNPTRETVIHFQAAVASIPTPFPLHVPLFSLFENQTSNKPIWQHTILQPPLYIFHKVLVI